MWAWKTYNPLRWLGRALITGKTATSLLGSAKSTDNLKKLEIFISWCNWLGYETHTNKLEIVSNSLDKTGGLHLPRNVADLHYYLTCKMLTKAFYQALYGSLLHLIKNICTGNYETNLRYSLVLPQAQRIERSTWGNEASWRRLECILKRHKPERTNKTLNYLLCSGTRWERTTTTLVEIFLECFRLLLHLSNTWNKTVAQPKQIITHHIW